ncbi:hypothetical protein I4U23_000181, partial [Adineta vaga]
VQAGSVWEDLASENIRKIMGFAAGSLGESVMSVDNLPLNCLKLINYNQDINSINFTYSCSDSTNYQLTTIYTLKSNWEFVEKQIYFANINNRNITSIQTAFTIVNLNIPSVSIIQNWQDGNKQHTIFLRSNSSALGIFATWQNPYGHYSVASNNQIVNSSYSIGISSSYLSEGFLIGFYQLSPYWHTSDINYAERAAYEKATTNDYQIDISTQQFIAEYKRLIDRCSQVGIKSITFAPSIANVSSRDQSTDDWNWESVLFLTLGQKTRLEQWKPRRDPIPPTIQELLDYAQLKQVKSVPYVYPPWLYPSIHCRTVCASLASIEFQQYFLQLLIDFAQVTGIAGYAWDYNFFYDYNHTTYSQWRGWQWIRSELIIALPHLIMDHRYTSQFDGPWSWITLNGYTSPLLDDENPETYPILNPTLHTDKVSADFMRRGNVQLRLHHFASMDVIPGFIGHQTERWADNDLRDFDLLGFSYSLLANIATAGLNLVHTMLPARDLQEFQLLPEEFIQFLTYWLKWTDEHIEEIRNGIPFNAKEDWSLMKSNGYEEFLLLLLFKIDGVCGEPGTQTTFPLFVILPTNGTISNVYVSGKEMTFQQTLQFISLNANLSFPGLYLPRSAEVLNNAIIVSDLVLKQLQKRQFDYPIKWTEKELNDASWLGPHRLLLFICIVNPDAQWNITAQIDNNPVVLHGGYNTRDHIDVQRFMGYYIDLTNIVTQLNVEYRVSIKLPQLTPGQFQGLFSENI